MLVVTYTDLNRMLYRPTDSREYINMLIACVKQSYVAWISDDRLVEVGQD